MSQLSDRAKALKQREDRLRKELQQVLAEAGGHMLKSPAEIEGADLEALRSRARELKQQMDTVEADRDSISTAIERLEEIKSLEANISAGIKELTDNLDPIYEEIGRLAFEVYRGNPLVDEEYANIFAPLVEVHSELSGIDASIAEQNALVEQKPFLEKMVVRGKIALLRNRKLTREGSFKRLVRTAGRDIMGTPFVEEIGDPGLLRATEPYRDRLKSVREHETELAGLDQERNRINEKLESLSAARRPQNRIGELESDLDVLSTAQAAVLAELAGVIRDAGKEVPAKCKPFFKTADGLTAKLERVAAFAARAEAGLEAERLERMNGLLERDIKSTEQRLKEITEELSGFRSRRDENRKALDESLKKRGDLDELLSDSLLEDL